MSFAATLRLQAEKSDAHSRGITSGAFSPDGKTIVSGSYDATIKVWDAAHPRPYEASEWQSTEGPFPGATKHGSPDLTVVTYWQNTVTGDVRRENSPAGVLPPKIITVWDAGGFFFHFLKFDFLNLTFPVLRSYAAVTDREEQCTQFSDFFRGLLSRWKNNSLRLL